MSDSEKFICENKVIDPPLNNPNKLPWLISDKNVYNHNSQISIIVNPNGQLSLQKVCECQSPKILNKDISQIKIKRMPIGGLIYDVLYTNLPEDPINRFPSNLFKDNITGMSIIYRGDNDIHKEELDILIKYYERGG